MSTPGRQPPCAAGAILATSEETRADRWPRLSRALRTVAVVVSVATYTAIAPVGYLAFIGLSWAWRRDPVARAHRLQRCMGGGYRFMHRWLSMLRIAEFDYRDALPGLPDGPCVIVANHPTQLDVTAIGATIGGGCTIAKRGVYRRRLLRPLLRGAGLIEGPGADPVSIGRVVDDAVQRLGQGMRMFVFPEGSRSPPGALRRFGRVPFEIACRARVPLVSVGIRCEPIWLSREVPLYRPPHPMPELRLELLAVDDPVSAGCDSRVLRERAEARFRAWLEAAP